MVAGWPIEETKSAICFVGRDLPAEMGECLIRQFLTTRLAGTMCSRLVERMVWTAAFVLFLPPKVSKRFVCVGLFVGVEFFLAGGAFVVVSVKKFGGEFVGEGVVGGITTS